MHHIRKSGIEPNLASALSTPPPPNYQHTPAYEVNLERSTLSQSETSWLPEDCGRAAPTTTAGAFGVAWLPPMDGPSCSEAGPDSEISSEDEEPTITGLFPDPAGALSVGTTVVRALLPLEEGTARTGR